jgi:multidrug transporter EmrE-like cation transporter
MNFWPLFLLVSGGIILTVGDFFMKKWVAGSGHTFYFLGLVIYLIALNFLAQSYRFQNIAGASVVMTIINTILLLVISYLYFKEPLNVFQIAGMIFGVAAIILLEIT